MTRKLAPVKKRYWLLLIASTGIIAIAVSVGSIFGAEVSTYSKGASIYADFGCGTCHESLVLGPIQRRRKPAPHLFEDWIEASELSEEVLRLNRSTQHCHLVPLLGNERPTSFAASG